MKTFLLLLSLAACSNSEKIYRHDGTVCHEMYHQYCGIALASCENQKEYECVHDLKVEIKDNKPNGA